MLQLKRKNSDTSIVMTTKQSLNSTLHLSDNLMGLESVKLIDLKAHSENNGTLIPITAHKEIPIALTRIFYILGVDAGETRGEHAHVQCSQVLICPTGKCKITCTDGESEKTFYLDSPKQALYVPPTIWMTQTYEQAGSMLIVLTDRPYEEPDYIREYQAYLRFRGVSAKRVA